MQALIFDFDGLILDTETPELAVWTEVFHDHGVELPPGYWSGVIGRGAEQEIERPGPLLTRLTGGTFVDTPEGHQERRGRILELIARETVRPGVQDLVREAREARIPVGIASSSRHLWVDRYLERFGLVGEFRVVVCADDVTRAKPFPDLYLEACRRLEVVPARAIALEDSPNGIAAAKAAGLFAVAVPNCATAPLDLSAADLRIGSLADVSLHDLIKALEERGKSNN